MRTSRHDTLADRIATAGVLSTILSSLGSALLANLIATHLTRVVPSPSDLFACAQECYPPSALITSFLVTGVVTLFQRTREPSLGPKSAIVIGAVVGVCVLFAVFVADPDTPFPMVASVLAAPIMGALLSVILAPVLIRRPEEHRAV